MMETPIDALAADTGGDVSWVGASYGGSAPVLSILIPVFNVAPYLVECLDSICRQCSRPGIEILIEEDCSTDRSADICRTFQQCYPELIRLRCNPVNSGIGATRNRLIGAARGDYVWFIDSDDTVADGAIEWVFDKISQQSPDILMFDYVWRGRHMASFSGAAGCLSDDKAARVAGLFETRRLHLWSRLFRRGLWAHAPRFPECNSYEDVAVVPALFLSADSHYYEPRPLIHYRSRSGSIMQRVANSADVCQRQTCLDMAHALTGFSDAARRMGAIDAEGAFQVGAFCAREFTKACWRLVIRKFGMKDAPRVRQTAASFRRQLETCSPLPFRQVARGYRHRGCWMLWATLSLCLSLSR